MDRTSNPGNFNSLPKSGILKGHKAFQEVLENAIVFSAKHIRIFAVTSEIIADCQSPPFTSQVRVGFLITKRRIKKAVMRNRIRRLLKESYRKMKCEFELADRDVCLIFTLTNEGYLKFAESTRGLQEMINTEFHQLSDKLKGVRK